MTYEPCVIGASGRCTRWSHSHPCPSRAPLGEGVTTACALTEDHDGDHDNHDGVTWNEHEVTVTIHIGLGTTTVDAPASSAVTCSCEHPVPLLNGRCGMCGKFTPRDEPPVLD